MSISPVESSPSRNLQPQPEGRGLLGGAVAALLLAGLAALRPSPPAARLDLLPIRPGTATRNEIAALPGASAGLAARIVAFRRQIGPVTPGGRLGDVPGVGARRLHAWSRWLEDDPAGR